MHLVRVAEGFSHSARRDGQLVDLENHEREVLRREFPVVLHVVELHERLDDIQAQGFR